ncbi:MAG: dihydroneopterin aldolase [Candidatus Eiseniibacteriota bacterium]
MAEIARITLADIGVVGFHGHLAAEKELGQRFELDVDLFVDIESPGKSDRLQDAVDYESVYRLVERVVREDRFNLLEALATDIVESIYKEFDVEGVVLRIRKPHIPYCPNLGHVEIEVERGRTGE